MQHVSHTNCFRSSTHRDHRRSLLLYCFSGALAETKKKAVQVRDKLVAAGEMREGIDEKREQYRPVATRGAVMYFTVVDLSLVNVMYQTSLDQFRMLFDRYDRISAFTCSTRGRFLLIRACQAHDAMRSI